MLAKIKSLGPTKSTHIQVEDTYFVLDALKGHVVRHRCDQEIQQLTIKSQGGNDTENRLEVNLNLGLSFGNQGASVEGFLKPFGIRRQATLHKRVHAFYFPQCEIVWYEAKAKGKSICCLEIEATKCETVAAAQAVIADYEGRLGLDSKNREHQSLFELLLWSDLTTS